MKLYALLAPMGVLAYTALALAFLTGLLKFKFSVRWIDLRWHIWLGIAAITLGTIHLLVAIFVNL